MRDSKSHAVSARTSRSLGETNLFQLRRQKKRAGDRGQETTGTSRKLKARK